MITRAVERVSPSSHCPKPNSTPLILKRGPDGALWFTEVFADRIGRRAPDGTIAEFPLPTPEAVPLDITVGSDRNLRFTEQAGNKLGRLQLHPGPIPLFTSGSAKIVIGLKQREP
jgi:virginiamycin B lyase